MAYYRRGRGRGLGDLNCPGDPGCPGYVAPAPLGYDTSSADYAAGYGNAINAITGQLQQLASAATAQVSSPGAPGILGSSGTVIVIGAAALLFVAMIAGGGRR